MGRPAVLKIDILADGKSAQAELGRTGDKASKMGAAVKAGAAVAAAGVVLLATEAAKSASAVEQAMGASEKVFAAYADGVQSNAAKADRALGLSKSGYLDLANIIGTQLKNAGTPMDQLTGKTDQLITKGADLAATFGGSTADAVGALSSALKGELDPIERYGVSLRKSDVNARLAEQGLDKLEGAALKAAEQQALLALINEQTAAATGAFADEANTAAGVGARASAVWENTKAVLGQGLLPILVAVGTFFLDVLAPAGERIAALFSANIGPASDRLSQLWSGKVVPAARLLWSWFMEKIVPGLRRAVIPVVESMQRRFAALRDAVDRNRPAIDKVLTVLRVVAEFIADKVAPVVGKLLAGAFDVGTAAVVGIIDVLSAVVNGISDAVSWFQRLIDKVQEFADKVSGSGVGRLVSAGWDALTGSAVAPGRLVASALAPGSLVAAGGAPAMLTGGTVNVAAPTVRVFIGERELTDHVRVVVEDHDRRTARRAALLTGRR